MLQTYTVAENVLRSCVKTNTYVSLTHILVMSYVLYRVVNKFSYDKLSSMGWMVKLFLCWTTAKLWITHTYMFRNPISIYKSLKAQLTGLSQNEYNSIVHEYSLLNI